ncbi:MULTISPECIES: hypothetical protein [unclassified Rhizobium]|uniref:hypothetical protein n=1 Tax=unclassified Rhizobium TaxID=2613769 RepID=UPI000AC18180|nr:MULTISPECIES: hypothetical protein [unclassified Rhizobium]
MGWKLFAGFNIFLGAIAFAYLVSGYEVITSWSVTSHAMSFLGTVLLVLYAFGGRAFSLQVRKTMTALFLVYAVAEASYLLWHVFQAHVFPTKTHTPLAALLTLILASSLSYFTLIAAWRYSQGHVIGTTKK